MKLPKMKKRSDRNEWYCYYRRKYHSLGRNEKEANRNYLALLSSIEDETYKPTPPARYTLPMLFADFLRHFTSRPSYSKSDYHKFVLLGRRVCELYPETNVKDFGPRSFKRVRASFLENGYTRRLPHRPDEHRQYSRQYINTLSSYLKHVFKWGVSEELVPEGIYTALTTIPPVPLGENGTVESEPRRPISDEVFNAVISHLRGFFRDITLVMRYTAMRPSEIIRMTVGDLTIDNGVMLYTMKRHKNSRHGKTRIIPLGPKSQSIILSYIKDKPSDAHVFSTEDSFDDVCQANGWKNNDRVKHYNEMSEPALRNALRRAHLDAIRDGTIPEGTPLWTPYSIRHLAITSVGKSDGIIAGQRLAGHSHLRTTEIYSHQGLSEAIEIAMKHG